MNDGQIESREEIAQEQDQSEQGAPSGRLGRFLEERLRLSVFNYAIPEHANTIWYALGGTTLSAFVLLVMSGVFLSQFYSPSITGAHDSILYIIEKAPLGWFFRGIHHWAAQIMFVAILLHVIRIIVSGSYKKPREITFYTGLLLFLTTFTLILTGTVVKWDQEGFEALAHFVGVSSYLGPIGSFFSAQFSPATDLLSRVFSLHASLLPMALLVLVAAHFYLVKVLKISPRARVPLTDQPATAPFAGHIRLLLKVFLGVTALVMVLAVLFRPPFGAPPMSMETGVKPPWMVLWIYALENKFGLLGVLYGIGGLVAALAAFPLIDRGPELRLGRRKAALALLILLATVLIGLSILGWISEPVIHSQM